MEATANSSVLADNISARPRVLVPITAAWGVRNLVLSGLAEQLSRSLDVVFAAPKDRDLSELLAGWETVSIQAEDHSDRRHANLKQRLGRAHHWVASQNVAGTLLDLQRRGAPLSDRVLVTANSWRARVEARPDRYRRLADREYQRWMELNQTGLAEARQVLEPFDAVFFPAPHSSRERWLSRFAKRLGLRTIAMIHSFDNPTTTSRHAIQFDHYLVWNEQMRDELLRVYPEINPDCISCLGTPHFHFYHDPEFSGSREELVQRHDLDTNRPVLLYAGGPQKLVPHEVPLVERLMHDLDAFDPGSRPQVIVRPHPIERDFERWEVLRRQFPEVRWSLPWANSPDEAEWAIPTVEGIREFCTLVRHSDVVINSCSTMSIDAAMCDTPVVCIDYALPPFADFESFVHRYYNWDHYVPVVQSGGIRVAKSPAELVENVRKYLRDPGLDREGRQALVRSLCGPDPSGATTLIVNTIVDLVRN